MVGDDVDELVVTMPTRYGPARVPSHRSTCYRCSDPVWLSNRAPIDLRARVVCVVCAMAIVEAGQLIVPAPWIAADLAARVELGDRSDEL